MARIQPFDQSGIVRGADGIARYENLPGSVPEMLRVTVEHMPDAECVVEVGGRRLTYGETWDRVGARGGRPSSRGNTPRRSRRDPPA